MKALSAASTIIAGLTLVTCSYLHASSLAPAGSNVQPAPTQQTDTTANYRLLASQYRQKEQVYRAKAAEEKVEWDRRKQITGSIAEKYPRPVDSARNLYEYYAAKAEQSAQKATEFETRAGLR
jgi:hypothetical protein